MPGFGRWKSGSRTPRTSRGGVQAAAACTLVAMLGSASPIGCQEVRLAVAQGFPSNDLLGSPQLMEVSVGTVGSPVSVRFGFQYGRDNFSSTGSTCVGLLGPGVDCSVEPTVEAARTRAWSLQLPLQTDLTWGDLRLIPGIRWMSVSSVQTGQVSDRSRDAEKDVAGYQIGLEVRTDPLRSFPLSFHAGAHFSRHPWFGDGLLIDGYSPFESTLDLSWIEIGLTLDRPTRSRP